MSELENLANVEICVVIALRLKNERLRNGWSQATISQLTGIPLRTYKRFESSGKGQTETLVAVLRALNKLRLLEILLPPPAIPTQRDSLAGRIGRLRKSAQQGA